MIDKVPPALVVLDGGAHMGAVHPGALQALQDQKINVFAYAGISIGSVMAAFASNGKSQDEMRRLMLQDFLNTPDAARSLIPPLVSAKRLALGGFVDQVPGMRKLVRKFQLEPNDKLMPLAFDLNTRRFYRFAGDYDLGLALAAACAPWPAARPVEYRDRQGKTHYLIDALAYLLHKERICPGNPSVIARLFPVSRRSTAADEVQSMIGFPRGKIFTRVTPVEYDSYWQHGYDRMSTSLKEALDKGVLPLLPCHRLR